jgi:hypothetical protein
VIAVYTSLVRKPIGIVYFTAFVRLLRLKRMIIDNITLGRRLQMSVAILFVLPLEDIPTRQG